jgi:hypothetical protein
MGASCSLVMVLLPHVTSHTTPSQENRPSYYEENEAKNKKNAALNNRSSK